MVDDSDIQVPVLKLLLAIVKYTTLLDGEPWTGEAADSHHAANANRTRTPPPPPAAIDIKSNTGTDAVSVILSCMERHPSDLMVARLGCELLAAIHYRVYRTRDGEAEADPSRQHHDAVTPPGILGRIPDINPALSKELEARGLVTVDSGVPCVQVGGKSMAQALHAWLPGRYPEVPAPEEEASN